MAISSWEQMRRDIGAHSQPTIEEREPAISQMGVGVKTARFERGHLAFLEETERTNLISGEMNLKKKSSRDTSKPNWNPSHVHAAHGRFRSAAGIAIAVETS